MSIWIVNPSLSLNDNSFRLIQEELNSFLQEFCYYSYLSSNRIFYSNFPLAFICSHLENTSYSQKLHIPASPSDPESLNIRFLVIPAFSGIRAYRESLGNAGIPGHSCTLRNCKYFMDCSRTIYRE